MGYSLPSSNIPSSNEGLDHILGDAYTENGARSLSSSGCARVDLFMKLTRDVVENELFDTWLANSWSESPIDTMKLIFNSRDCRGGKGDRAPFLAAMAWVYENHPEWFSCNVDIIPVYGRWLDLIELLPAITSESQKNAIVELMAKQLKQDVEAMNNGSSVSLLAKWFPSENKKWDVTCNTTELMSEALFGGSEPCHKRQLRKEFLTPLRKHIEIVERSEKFGDWNSIDFSKVPSVAMNRLRVAFKRNAPDSFDSWLEQVASGEKKINASQVYPHTLVAHYLNKMLSEVDEAPSALEIDQVVEEQWKEVVKKTQELGTFANSLVISDVSGSMMGTPMEVSIALGILIATVTQAPFNDMLITFSENPQLHSIKDCSTLAEKVSNVSKMEWDMTTDLKKVFDVILCTAVENNAPPENMPTRVYILSDMQFDEATSGETNYEYIQRKYESHGYKLPEIVFWNLRSNSTRDMPAMANDQGVGTISGFSPSILKALMEGQSITPYTIMRLTIDDPRYDLVKSPSRG